MLSRNMRYFLLSDNDDKGANPETPQAQDKGDKKEAEKLFSQDDLNRIGKKEKAEGKAAAEKAFLDLLGVSSIDELKNVMEAKRKAEDAEKSELEKLQEELNRSKQEAAEAKQAAEKAESQRRLDNRNSQLRNLLLDAFEPQSALLLFLSKHEKDASALVDEAGQFDSKEAEKLIAVFKTGNAYLFKGQSKGSPSNAEGRLLSPATEVRKEAAKEIRKKFNF